MTDQSKRHGHLRNLLTISVAGSFLLCPGLNRVSTGDELAEVFFRRGSEHLSEGDIRGRMLARRYYQRAIDRDPGNIEYLTAMAAAWEASGFPENARSLYERIVELDPHDVESHYQLAELYAADTNYYTDMYAAEGRISFDLFSSRDADKARRHYQSALTLDPEHRDALRGMALFCLRRQESKELVRLGRRLIDLEPDQPDGYLLTGIGLARRAEFNEANLIYSQALLRLMPGQRNAYHSLVSVLHPDKAEYYGRFNPETRRRFEAAYWKIRDPLYLTACNERELIHFTRIASSEFLFGDPERGVRGWETDQGQVFVRYGRPGRVFKRWTAFDEEWVYHDFSLRFEDYFRSGNSRFAWSEYSDPLNADWMRFEGIVRDHPAYHYVDFAGRRFAFPYVVSTFKDKEPDKTLLEVSIGVPLPRLVVDDSLKEVRVREGFFVFDEDYEIVAESVVDKEFNLPYGFRPQADQYLIDQQLISLPPGSYTLAVEVADRNGRAFGSSRLSQEIQSYRAESLRLSDLTLASKVFGGRGISFYRQDLAVHPNPLMEFHREEGLAAYFGVYNLALGADGRSRYSVTTRISRIDERGAVIRMVAGLLGRAGREGLSITSNYGGLFPDEMRVLTIDVQRLTPGRYRMEIEVGDLLGDVVESREREFRLVD